MALDLTYKVGEIGLNGGYIKTDKDGGSGSMTAVGDNISPFEDGNQVYGTDAKTTYGSVGYTIGAVALGALYGETKYGVNNDKEEELDLTAEYTISESLTASLVYADINAEDSTTDYNKVLASVEYTF